MAMQGFIVRQLINMGVRATKTKGVRTLGKQLLKELAPGGNKQKAIGIASKITVKVEKMGLAGPIKRAKWWKNITGGRNERIVNLEGGNQLRKGIFHMDATAQSSPSYWAKLGKVPIIDIDFDDGLSHAKSQISFGGGSIRDQKTRALNHLWRLYKNSPHEKFRVDRTHAGLRIFNLARRQRPDKHTRAIDKALGGDKYYRRGTIRDKGFNTRLFVKPGRDEKQVAETIDMIGKGVTNPKNIRDIKRYHDDLIRLIAQATKEKGYANMNGLFQFLDKKYGVKSIDDLAQIIGNKAIPKAAYW